MNNMATMLSCTSAQPVLSRMNRVCKLGRSLAWPLAGFGYEIKSCPCRAEAEMDFIVSDCVGCRATATALLYSRSRHTKIYIHNAIVKRRHLLYYMLKAWKAVYARLFVNCKCYPRHIVTMSVYVCLCHNNGWRRPCVLSDSDDAEDRDRERRIHQKSKQSFATSAAESRDVF